MARRIYIIRKDAEITNVIRAQAEADDCGEIARGIPPILRAKLWGKKLPLVYEEPEPVPSEPPRDLAAEIDEIKAEMELLKERK